VAPLDGDLHGRHWCGHDWSEWQSLEDLSSVGGTGLYRLRSSTRAGLVYVGQGVLGKRLRQHRRAARTGDRAHGAPLSSSSSADRTSCPSLGGPAPWRAVGDERKAGAARYRRRVAEQLAACDGLARSLHRLRMAEALRSPEELGEWTQVLNKTIEALRQARDRLLLQAPLMASLDADLADWERKAEQHHALDSSRRQN
jgi:hypothetical protein